MKNPGLAEVDASIAAFLHQHPDIDSAHLLDALGGADRVSLDTLTLFGDCLANSTDKHTVKFGALALLSAMAWSYDPSSRDTTPAQRNRAAAMSMLVGAAYQNRSRVAETAASIADEISDPTRDRSIEEIREILFLYEPVSTTSSEVDTQNEFVADGSEKIVDIVDPELQHRVAEFPWIDTPADDIELKALLVEGLQGKDVLVVDLSVYSSRMKAVIDDANAHFSEDIFRSIELQQIAKLLTGDQSGYLIPPSSRDSSLPDTYCSGSNSASNANVRRLYTARIGQYQGLPVFARLGYSRTKRNQSRLSVLLGYHPVQC